MRHRFSEAPSKAFWTAKCAKSIVSW